MRHAESAVAESPQMLMLLVLPACGVESEQLGSGSGHLGSNQQASDFVGVLLFKLLVCGKLFFLCI